MYGGLEPPFFYCWFVADVPPFTFTLPDVVSGVSSFFHGWRSPLLRPVEFPASRFSLCIDHRNVEGDGCLAVRMQSLMASRDTL